MRRLSSYSFSFLSVSFSRPPYIRLYGVQIPLFFSFLFLLLFHTNLSFTIPFSLVSRFVYHDTGWACHILLLHFSEA